MVMSQIDSVMGTLVQFKRQVFVLEADCTMLHTMVINLSKGDQSCAIHSNCGALKEDETVHQLPENAKVVKVDLDLGIVALDKATNRHTFF
jgi:hypothetical protein